MERFDVEGYALYPGLNDVAPGLHVSMKPGLTLVIGANGLGKTTLITLLFRILTGPADIPTLGPGEELGTRRLESKSLPAFARQIFAQRVSDRAAQATARLVVTFGEQKFLIERKLSDLALARFEIDGVAQHLSEDNYHLMVARAVGVWSFGDFVLMLRYLVFYFEDRRALVWDPSAQRQVLRLLYLPADVAESWTISEREILELDSRMRNLQSALGREERQLGEVVDRAAGGENVRQQLSLLEKLQAQDRAKLEAAEEETVGLDEAREKARLEHLLTERERDARLRNLERAKLAAIDARFPKRSETARYILAHLMTEAECLVCGNRAPEAAATYLHRVEHHHCVVCDTKLQQIENVIGTTDLADKRTEQSRVDLAEADDALVKRRADLKEAEEAHRAHVEQLARLEAAIADRAVKINALVRNLPASETAVHEQRDAVNTIRATLARLKSDLSSKRKAFEAFVAQTGERLAAHASDVQQVFEEYAQGFLVEQTRLSFAPQRARVGQTGESIAFPAFNLEMTGSDFATAVRRTNPSDVSESQREFIDLAFRMALMKTAGSGGQGSLVIDAPESSLDTVFATRAAQILARFATSAEENRLVVTSNVVEGSLVPTLLREAVGPVERESRIVDLFELARPTAAYTENKAAYDKARRDFVYTD